MACVSPQPHSNPGGCGETLVNRLPSNSFIVTIEVSDVIAHRRPARSSVMAVRYRVFNPSVVE